MRTIELIDTHCHIHDLAMSSKFEDKKPVLMIDEARSEGVSQFICVGTDLSSSQQAIDFSDAHDGCHASIALHPHEAEKMSINELDLQIQQFEILLQKKSKSIVAIGECGLDFYYHDSAKTHEKQEWLLRKHLDLAITYNLPVIFHIRDPKNGKLDHLGHAFERFFTIIDEYEGIQGVIHSFSAGHLELEGALRRGFFIGLNGIMTFSKQTNQLQAAKMVPLERLVLETDAPFLTPAPFRGKMCEPKYVRITASFLSELRGESLEEIALATTSNAKKLFNLI